MFDSPSLSDPIEEVRVVPAGTVPRHTRVGRTDPDSADLPARTEADVIRATILDTAESKLREARDLVSEALEMFDLVETPQHRNLATILGQQIEQVIEYRRLKQ